MANVVVGKFRSQDVIDPSCFTKPALKRWESIPGDLQHRLLRNAWCPHCTKQVGITSFTGRMLKGDLILSGQCTQCKGAVARMI